jgi:uncharacterized protein YxjI
VFDKNTYVVKERIGFLKLGDIYDIYEGESGRQVAIAMEKPGLLLHALRLVVNKTFLPTTVKISTDESSPPFMMLRRGVHLFGCKVQILDGDGSCLGALKSRGFSWKTGFKVLDAQNQQVAEVKGNWTGRDFRLLDAQGRELGVVAKKWGGLAKELFTSADTYAIHINDGQPERAVLLLIAAGLAIDTVYHEY